jgi:hypothetical protein
MSDDGAYYSEEGVSEGSRSRASDLIAEYFPSDTKHEKSYTIAELKAMSPTELNKLISEN